jgi:G3E family GTPase
MPETLTTLPTIHLITGYLGSGKTLFLLRALERRLFQEPTALIVNDFGAVSFDGVSLGAVREASAGVEIIDVPGGCLCCSAIEDFQKALQAVIARGAQRIFIEATGLADAAQAQRDLAFMGYPLDSTLCVVDALNYRRFQTLFHVVNAQIQAADFLLLSKTDLVKSENAVQDLTEKLRVLNARAPLVRLNKGSVESSFLLTAFARAERFVPQNEGETNYSEQLHLLRDDVAAFRILLPNHVDFAALERALATLPPEIVRLKGFVRLEGSPKPILLNYVAGAWGYQPLSTAVKAVELFAIGRRVERQDVERAFHALGASVRVGTVKGLGVMRAEETPEA